MTPIDRDHLALLWQGILAHTGKTQDLFGAEAERLLIAPLGHVDQLPHPGYVGRNYQRGGLLFLAMNPGNGPSGPDPDQEPHYAGLRRLGEAAPRDRRAAFEALMAYDESWHAKIRIMNVIVQSILDGVGCGQDEIAFLNILKWRTRDSSGLAPLYRISMQDHTLTQLETLDPGLIVLLGVGASKVVHGLPDFEQKYGERSITIPRTRGDYYLDAAGLAAVQEAIVRFRDWRNLPQHSQVSVRPLQAPQTLADTPTHPSPLSSPRRAYSRSSSPEKPQADLNREQAGAFRARMHAEAASRGLRIADYLLEPGRDNDIRLGLAGPRHAIVVLAQKMAARGATYGDVLGKVVTKGDGTPFKIGEGELLGYVCANGYCLLKPPSR